MELNEILREVELLQRLLNRMSEQGNVASIERDIALEHLRRLYDMILLLETTNSPQTALEDNNMLIASISAPTIEEPIVEAFDFSEFEIESTDAAQEGATDLSVEEPYSEPIEEMTEPEQVFEPEPQEPQTEERSFEEQLSTPNLEEATEQIEETTEQIEETTEHKEEATEHIAEEPTEHIAEEPRTLQSLLFGEEEIPHPRKSSRRVLMSLYGENSNSYDSLFKEQTTSKEKPVKEEPVKEVQESPTDSSEPDLTPFIESVSTSEEPPIQEQEQPFKVELEPSVQEAEEVFISEPEAPKVEESHESEPTVADTLPESSTTILGELLQNDKAIVGESVVPKPDVASQLSRGSLSEMISLNDRFLMIRELFAGNRGLYDRAMAEFDAMPTFDDALVHIAENYMWNPNSEATKLLLSLLERKFGEA